MRVKLIFFFSESENVRLAKRLLRGKKLKNNGRERNFFTPVETQAKVNRKNKNIRGKNLVKEMTSFFFVKKKILGEEIKEKKSR